jgi:hypothetical protein
MTHTSLRISSQLARLKGLGKFNQKTWVPVLLGFPLRGIHFARIEGFGGVGFYDAMMSDLAQIQKDVGDLTVYETPTVAVEIDGPTNPPNNAFCT